MGGGGRPGTKDRVAPLFQSRSKKNLDLQLMLQKSSGRPVHCDSFAAVRTLELTKTRAYVQAATLRKFEEGKKKKGAHLRNSNLRPPQCRESAKM